MPETPEIPDELPLAEAAAALAEPEPLVPRSETSESESAQTQHVPEAARESAAMIDIHDAHHAASTWREFFIHIATIAIGLLLAVGLEQTVEYIHHRRELTEARRELAEEKQFNAEEFRHSAESFQVAGEHLKSYLTTLRQSIKDPARPLPVLVVPVDYFYSQYTAWTTAQRDGALTLMPPEEQRGIDRMYVGLHAVDDMEDAAYKAILHAGAVFGSGRTTEETIDFSGGMDPKGLTLEEKKELYKDLSQALADVDGVIAVHKVTTRFNPEFAGKDGGPDLAQP